MTGPRTPKTQELEDLEALLAREKVKQAKLKIRQLQALRKASKGMTLKAIELLQNDDLKAKDIPPSLILRRLLFCSFADTDSNALANLKHLSAIVNAKQKVKDDDEGITESPGEKDAVAELLET